MQNTLGMPLMDSSAPMLSQKVPALAACPSQLHSLTNSSQLRNMHNISFSASAGRPPRTSRLPNTQIAVSRLDCKPPASSPSHPSLAHTIERPLPSSSPSPLHHQSSPHHQNVVRPASTPTPMRTSWNPLQKLAAAALDIVEQMIIASLEQQHPLPSTTDPLIQLEGNFFPVPENPVQHELEVEGSIPVSLEGMYIRNGANPMFEPVAGHHLFDGDGMLHAIRFKQGIVSYA
eukprot:c25606_g1_i1 orf=1-693(-)